MKSFAKEYETHGSSNCNGERLEHCNIDRSFQSQHPSVHGIVQERPENSLPIWSKLKFVTCTCLCEISIRCMVNWRMCKKHMGSLLMKITARIIPSRERRPTQCLVSISKHLNLVPIWAPQWQPRCSRINYRRIPRSIHSGTLS